jgi:uncharacterized protein YndB with AHSA1/START domain
VNEPSRRKREAEHIVSDTQAGVTSDREIVVTRVFDAPRERVFEAWTDPERVVQWWGPRGFTTTIHEMDVRPGGIWRFTMHGPDGTDYPNRVEFTEVTKPQRLVYDHGPDAGAEGLSFRSTVTFEDEGGGTRLTLRLVFKSAEERDRAVEFGAREGGKQTLERLAEHLGKS